MPLSEKVTVGGWVLNRTDTESQIGIVKLFISLPKGLNAQKRTAACTLVNNFRRALNVGIRKGELVIKLAVSDSSHEELVAEIDREVKKILHILNREISINPRTGARPSPSGTIKSQLLIGG